MLLTVLLHVPAHPCHPVSYYLLCSLYVGGVYIHYTASNTETRSITDRTLHQMFVHTGECRNNIMNIKF